MKSLKIWYWVVTGLMALFMALGAVLDTVKHPDAVKLIVGLGYPEYLVPFLGVLKLLGIATILAPGLPRLPFLPRLKEWAYAGLVFDTGGALYSHFSAGSKAADWFPALLGLVLVLGSYTLYTRGARATHGQVRARPATDTAGASAP